MNTPSSKEVASEFCPTTSEQQEIQAKLVLLSLPKLGPARARWLLGDRSAIEVVRALRSGQLPKTSGQAPRGVTSKVLSGWYSHTRSSSGGDRWAQEQRSGASILDDGSPYWPFTADPEPPLLMFYKGELKVLSQQQPRVAVVGTRQCSTVGKRVAYDLGRDLSEAGVVVVSGLAAGIDAAAHAGVLAVGNVPLAVVGTGLDVVYPKVNGSLWRQVEKDGLVLTEAPAGTRPERWRFPARNRLIAGLVDAVVVVESHESGGALITVDEALRRDRQIFAVPGSVTNPAAVGTNGLLAEGCQVARDAADILAAVGGGRVNVSVNVNRKVSVVEDSVSTTILQEIGAGPVHVDHLIGQTGLGPVELYAKLAELEAQNLAAVKGSYVEVAPG